MVCSLYKGTSASYKTVQFALVNKDKGVVPLGTLKNSLMANLEQIGHAPLDKTFSFLFTGRKTQSANRDKAIHIQMKLFLKLVSKS